MPVGSKLIALLSTSFPLRPSFVFRLARYSRPTFAALSSASVFHGRIHSVFNRPKLGFWSRAINQFHSEAVINEGCGEAATSFSDSNNSHPWPELSKLADMLAEKGYSDRCMASGDDDDSFLVEENMPEKFLKAAEACLGFARDRPDILRLLAKKNMETIVLNGSPFLFKNGENSARRMKLFLSGEGSNELELERAQTIDIMRYLLSYAYGPLTSSHDSNLKSDEHVEPSVRKLLCELFNLSGTVWKPKSVDATLTELPLSNDRLSGHPGQYFETKTADWINPKIPGRSSAGSESQLNASCNFTDKEYGNTVFNQKQGPDVTISSQTGLISTPNGRFIENSAQPSTSVLDKNVESWNRVQTSSISNAQISKESNAVYGSTNSSEPPSHLRNNFNNYYGGYTGKPSQPSGNLWTKIELNNNISSTESTAHPSQPPSSYQGNYSARYDGYSNASQTGFTSNSSPPSSGYQSYDGHNNASQTEITSNLSLPPSGYQGYDGFNNASQTGFTSNSSPPPSCYQGYNGHNNASQTGFTSNSSLPPGGYRGYDGHNNGSQTGFTSNLSPPPRGYRGYDGHNNASQTGFTSNSSPSPRGYQGYDGHTNASQIGFTSNSSLPLSGYQGYNGHNNASQTGFTSNSSPPPRGYRGYDEHNNASQAGFTSNLSPPPRGYQGYDGHNNASQIRFTSNSSPSPRGYQGYDGHNNASQIGFTSNSSPPPSGYQGYDGHNHASQTRFTSNSSPPPSGYRGYDGHDNASQTGFTSKSSLPPSGYPGYDGHNNASQIGFTSNSSLPPSGYQGYDGYNNASQTGFTSNSSPPPSGYQGYDGHNNTSQIGSTSNSPPPSSNSWNTHNNTSSGGFNEQFKQPSSNSYGAQAHSLNGGVNGNYGYSGKSLEGSCVKEPDPLDMSEEAKAERWFRRAAQIKDISELSQIPDEDFPQIMPLRKGVNRFVVSKRKTPLERRLASQQYKRSLPVVSSEPENDPTAGEKEN